MWLTACGGGVSSSPTQPTTTEVCRARGATEQEQNGVVTAAARGRSIRSREHALHLRRRQHDGHARWSWPVVQGRRGGPRLCATALVSGAPKDSIESTRSLRALESSAWNRCACALNYPSSLTDPPRRSSPDSQLRPWYVRLPPNPRLYPRSSAARDVSLSIRGGC